MQRCAQCGTELEPDERFCGNCGAPAAASPPSLPPRPDPPASAGRPASVVPWILVGCLLLFFGAGVTGLGIWWWMGGGERSALSGPPTASPESTATATGSPQAAGLEELAGTWALDPSDPRARTESTTRIALEARDGILVARDLSSSGEELRLLELEGEDVRGEYRDASGRVTPVTGRYEDGRLRLTVEGETGTLVRADALPSPPASPAGVVLFQDRGDLDGDGTEETVVIVDEAGTTDPVTPSGRHLEVRDASGRAVYRTETWEVPFRPDLDHLAGGPENTAGVHVVPGNGRHPDIRVVFVPASEDFATWRYDGVQYGLAR